MQNILVETVLPALLSLLSLAIPFVLTFAIKAFHSWVDGYVTRTNHSKGALLLQRVAYLTSTIVTEVELSIRPYLKAALADGKISEEEGKEMKGIALAKLKSILGSKGKEELEAVLGIFNLDAFLSGQIESAVAGLKVAKAPLAEAPAPPSP